MAENSELEVCPNCNKPIPHHKSATHFGYCRRNILKCNRCHQMFDKNFPEDHEEEFHTTTECPFCKKGFRNQDYAGHQGSCDMQPKECEYCQMRIPLRESSGHRKICESRTSPCDICEKPILNKDFLAHKYACKKPPQELKAQPKHFSKLKEGFDQFEDSLDQEMWTMPKKQIKIDKKQPKKVNHPKEGKPKVDSPSGWVKKQKSKIESPTKNNVKKKVPKDVSYRHVQENYLSDSRGFDFQDYNPYAFETEPETNFHSSEGSGFDGMLTEEEQMMQQILQESSWQKGKAKKSSLGWNLPSDFDSQELMSKSFYNDILDIEKQKAILKDVQRKKR